MKGINSQWISLSIEISKICARFLYFLPQELERARVWTGMTLGNLASLIQATGTAQGRHLWCRICYFIIKWYEKYEYSVLAALRRNAVVDTINDRDDDAEFVSGAGCSRRTFCYFEG